LLNQFIPATDSKYLLTGRWKPTCVATTVLKTNSDAHLSYINALFRLSSLQWLPSNTFFNSL